MSLTFTQLNNALNSNIKLSEIINLNTRTISVFDKYGVDYCNKGNRSIKEVCKEKNIDVKIILNELNEISDEFQPYKFSEWKLDFLIDYIMNNHHQYIHKMILKINEQYEAIPLGMGQTQREQQNIYKMFSVIYKDLKQHMLKEEQILFPYIKQLITLREAGSKSEIPYFGKIDNPICMMENEHKSALDKFDELKQKTNNFIAPDISNQALKKFFNELKNFGKDLHIHIHLENNLLFPKAIALEKKML